jgi:hypothetical protein
MRKAWGSALRQLKRPLAWVGMAFCLVLRRCLFGSDHGVQWWEKVGDGAGRKTGKRGASFTAKTSVPASRDSPYVCPVVVLLPLELCRRGRVLDRVVGHEIGRQGG